MRNVTRTRRWPMELEELEPRKTQPKKKNLEVMSLAELEEYITELEAEIERARRE
ncbi:MAG: DUF1192 family protein, partial [Alphaproteobacteria bacterium]